MSGSEFSPEVLRVALEALEDAGGRLISFIKGGNASREKKWDHLMEAAAKARNIVERHVEAVKLATEPARAEGDLASSAKSLRKLVNSSEFPLAYPALDALLDRLSNVRTFSSVKPDILKLKKQLNEFQERAFMIKYSSWRVANWCERVAALVLLLATGDQNDPSTKSKIEKTRKKLNEVPPRHPWNAWTGLRQPLGRPYEPLVSPAEPESTEEMEMLVRDWLKAWFEFLQKTLYAPEGIARTVSVIEAARIKRGWLKK